MCIRYSLYCARNTNIIAQITSLSYQYFIHKHQENSDIYSRVYSFFFCGSNLPKRSRRSGSSVYELCRYPELIELGLFILSMSCSSDLYSRDPEVFRAFLWIASALRDSEARILSSVNSMLKYIALVVSNGFLKSLSSLLIYNLRCQFFTVTLHWDKLNAPSLYIKANCSI